MLVNGVTTYRDEQRDEDKRQSRHDRCLVETTECDVT